MALSSKFTKLQMRAALTISTTNKIFLLWQIFLLLKTNLDRISLHATYCCTTARASWCLSHKVILQRCSYSTWRLAQSFRRYRRASRQLTLTNSAMTPRMDRRTCQRHY
jgi:hypothetical protein